MTKDAQRVGEAADGMGKIKLNEARPNYIERPVVDPKKAMERAQMQVRAERNRRAHLLIASSARG